MTLPPYAFCVRNPLPQTSADSMSIIFSAGATGPVDFDKPALAAIGDAIGLIDAAAAGFAGGPQVYAPAQNLAQRDADG